MQRVFFVPLTLEKQIPFGNDKKGGWQNGNGRNRE